MESSAKEPKALTPLTLKSTLLESNSSSSPQEFFCVDKCKECFIYQDGSTVEYSNKVALENIVVHKIDQNNNTYKVDFGRYRDHAICLRFNIYSNKSSTQMIIEQNRKFYYLPTFFDKAIEVDSLDSAKSLWIDSSKKLRNSGDFH